MQAWILACREATLQIRSIRFRLLAAVVVVLAALTAVVGAGDVRARRAHQLQLEAHRERLRAEARTLLGRAIEPALRAVHAPAVGLVIARGVESAMPAYWDFGPSGVREGSRSVSAVMESFSALVDLESLVRVMLGLVAVLLGIEVIAGSRAAGTLWTLVHLPIAGRTIVLGQAAGAALTLSLLAFVLIATVLVTLYMFAPDLITGDLLARLGLFTIASCVYLAVMAASGVLVSSLTARHHVALLAGIGWWAYVALIGPQLVVFVVQAFVPLEHANAFETERDTLFDAHFHSTSVLLGTAYLRLGGPRVLQNVDHEPIPPAIDAELERHWRREMAGTRDIMSAVSRRLHDARALQAALIGRLAWASPGSLFVDLATELAGTGRRRRAERDAAIESYQEALNRGLFDDRPSVVMRVPRDEGFMFVTFDRRDPPPLQSVPPFEPRSDSLDRRLHHLARLAAGLALIAGLVALAATYVFPRSSSRFYSLSPLARR
jgi:ABC-type transport system involved in multi-copper enzyme maturation permease subunit